MTENSNKVCKIYLILKIQLVEKYKKPVLDYVQIYDLILKTNMFISL
jgi:hypothetical protein